MKKLTPRQEQQKLYNEAARIRIGFSHGTFSSKEDVARWMERQSSDLEKRGYGPADIFHILKIVQEKMI